MEQTFFLVLMGIALVSALASFLKKEPAKMGASLLDQVLLWWTPQDPFTVRSLLDGGVVILGRAGSGKTSSSGRTLLKNIVSNPKSGGLIHGAKPEDAAYIREIFREADRLDDLVLFDERAPARLNFLDYLRGEPALNIVRCLMTMGETLRHGQGKQGEDGVFWTAQQERLLYNAIVMLKAAREPVTAERIHQVIMTAANTPAEMAKDSWKQEYHAQVLKRAGAEQKSAQEENDFRLALDYWTLEYPTMADKTRSGVIAGVMGILHVFNTGSVREMVSGATNVSPDDILNGKWVLVNFPPSQYGEVGLFINAGWKYLTEMAVLKREAHEDSPFVTIWADEYSQFCNKFDADYICQCRSHRGCLVSLLQSVSSIYAAIPGEQGRHFADALLANYSHAIIHAADPVTAQWASGKLGQERRMMIGGSFQEKPDDNLFDQLFGKSPGFQGSFSEQLIAPIQPQEFQSGLATGGGPDFFAEAYLIRSGGLFSTGTSYLRIQFTQR